jgi:hypothetical protein
MPASEGSYASPDQHLSAEETAKISALLGTKGYSTSLSSSRMRTLHVQPCTWLTADERKDHAARIKAAGSSGTRKRREAYPGDDTVTSDNSLLDPFAEWPWEQSLLVHTADSYTMLGRRLRHALTCSIRYFTDQLSILSREQQEWERQRISKI